MQNKKPFDFASIWGATKTLAKKAAASDVGKSLIKQTGDYVQAKAGDLVKDNADNQGANSNIVSAVVSSEIGKALVREAGDFVQAKTQDLAKPDVTVKDIRTKTPVEVAASPSEQPLPSLMTQSASVIQEFAPPVIEKLVNPAATSEPKPNLFDAVSQIAASESVQKLAGSALSVVKEAAQPMVAALVSPASVKQAASSVVAQPAVAIVEKAPTTSSHEPSSTVTTQVPVLDAASKKALTYALGAGVGFWVVPMVAKQVLNVVMNEAASEVISSTLGWGALFYTGYRYVNSADIENEASPVAAASQIGGSHF